MKPALTFLLLCLTLMTGKCATIYALSGSYSDATNGRASCVAGDTLVLSGNGSFNWPTNFDLSGVSLIATGSVYITWTNSCDHGIYFNSAGNYITCSNLTLGYLGGGPDRYMIGLDGSNVCFRFSHLTITNSSTGIINGAAVCIQICTGNNGTLTKGPWGVMDGDNFYLPGGQVYNIINTRGNGTVNQFGWSNNMTWGTTNTVVVENCNFNSPACQPLSGVCEGGGGGRVAMRYSNVTNLSQSIHGPQSGDNSGFLQLEWYENNWQINDTNPVHTAGYLALQRGGSAVYWSNTIVNTSSAGSFGIGNGWEFWDECASSALWSSESCARQLLYPADYPSIQQIGQGVVNGAQGYQPVYMWGNTYPSLSGVLFVLGHDGGDAPFITQGVDVFTNTAKPGYVALTYPYPFIAQTNQPQSASFVPTGIFTR